MNVLVLKDGKLEQKNIENTLESLQEIVEGYIEIPFLSEALYRKGIDVIINEECKLIEGLRPEIAIIEKTTNRILDIIYGNCIFASHNDMGETTPLNEEQMKFINQELADVILSNEQITYVVKALLI